jgi:hypothetical protein
MICPTDGLKFLWMRTEFIQSFDTHSTCSPFKYIDIIHMQRIAFERNQMMVNRRVSNPGVLYGGPPRLQTHHGFPIGEADEFPAKILYIRLFQGLDDKNRNPPLMEINILPVVLGQCAMSAIISCDDQLGQLDIIEPYHETHQLSDSAFQHPDTQQDIHPGRFTGKHGARKPHVLQHCARSDNLRKRPTLTIRSFHLLESFLVNPELH